MVLPFVRHDNTLVIMEAPWFELDPHTTEAGRVPAPNRNQVEALTHLINEVRSSFHLLKAMAQQVHGGTELTAARRGVMLDLLSGGDRTVPELARMRPVSRQHIQIVVNGLLDEGWVDLRPNPAHKRSHLVSLTSRGKQVVTQMREREVKVLGEVELPLDISDLVQAAKVLSEMRAALERLRH